MRRHPPATRESVTHRVRIRTKHGPVDIYITAGLYPDHSLAELFVVLGKSGEALTGMARCWATCFSICLQMGVPLAQLVRKFEYFRFEPSGFTDNPSIPYAHSIADYACRWLEKTFVVPESPKPNGGDS